MRRFGKMTLEIDLKTLKPGCAIIGEVLGVRLAVCMGDDRKVRIFKVVERPHKGRNTRLEI